MSNYSYKTIAAIKLALSRPRISTFEAAVNIRDNNDPAAIKLYIWNALLSGALLTPLHICEVVIRNAVADALEKHFGPRWPWSVAFERNLPDPVHGYSARKALCYARRTGHSAEKIFQNSTLSSGKICLPAATMLISGKLPSIIFYPILTMQPLQKTTGWKFIVNLNNCEN